MTASSPWIWTRGTSGCRSSRPHIDFLQIRNGHIHILDYKPDARKETHAHVQLTIYALALARRTSLPLKFFKCGWFDEKDYYDFFPLQGVYRRRDQS